MIYTEQNPWPAAIAPNFAVEEFICRCGQCGTAKVDTRLLEPLQAIRGQFGRPMTITSGYRCPLHRAEATKKRPGAHSRGFAADIHAVGDDELVRLAHRAGARGLAVEVVASGAAAFELMALAHGAGVRGLGVNLTGPVASRFIHMDWDPSRSVPVAWSY